MASSYDIFHIASLDGGMVTSVSPRLLDQARGFSTNLENITTESPGVLKKRPAIKYMFDVPSGTHSIFHHKSMADNEEYFLAAAGTTVRKRQNGSWSTIMTGLQAGKPMDFITMADQAVMSNGFDPLAVWDGSTLNSNVGGEKATARTFLLFEHNDLRFTAKNEGEAGNYIRVRYIKHTTANTTATVSVTGAGTEEDPYFITVNLRWTEGDYGAQNITTTATNVVSLINNHTTAKTLIDVEHVAGSNGTRAVLEMPETPLVGGFDPVKGKYLIEYRLRAVMAGDEDQPSLLQLSHTGDPYWWSPHKVGSNAVSAFVSPDEGEGISGLCSMGDGGVLIGKPHSLYGLFGYKRENFVIDKLDPNIGVASHRSMAFARPNAYFVSYEGIFRIQPGGVPINISEAIRDIFENEVDHEQLHKSVAFIYRRQYIVSMPGKESNWVILCFHMDREKWCRWNQPAGLTDVILVHSDTVSNRYVSTDNNKLFRITPNIFIDEMPEEQPIEVVYESMELDAQLPHIEKDFGDLYIILQGQDTEEIMSVEVFFDGSDIPYLVTTPLSQTVPENKQVVVRINLAKTARFMNIKIYNNSPSNFKPLTMMYTYQRKEVL